MSRLPSTGGGGAANGRRLAGWLVLLLVVGSLAACAGLPGAGSAPPSPTVAPTVPPATRPPAPGATPVGIPTPVPPPMLTLWTSETGQTLDLVRTLAGEFGAQAGVQLHVVPKSAEDLRIDLLTAGLLNEPPPDLLWASHQSLAELLLDEQLQPVDAAVVPDMLLPALLEGASFDGQLWGVPLAASDPLLLLANRELVADLPTTTDELITQSRTFSATEEVGLVVAWGEGRWLLAWLNGFGGRATTPDGLQPTLDTPEMDSTLNLLRELFVAAPEEPADQGYAEGSARFAAGQAALAIDGAWTLPDYRASAVGPQLAIAPLPRIPATDRQAAPPLGGTYLLFQRALNDERLEYARGFAAYLTSPAVQRQIVSTTRRLPALRATLTDPLLTEDELLAAAAVQAEAAPGLPPTRAFRCALYGIEVRIGAVLAGDLENDEATRAMQQDAEGCMKLAEDEEDDGATTGA